MFFDDEAIECVDAIFACLGEVLVYPQKKHEKCCVGKHSKDAFNVLVLVMKELQVLRCTKDKMKCFTEGRGDVATINMALKCESRPLS